LFVVETVVFHTILFGIMKSDLKPEWFDDVDIESEGEPEMLKDEVFYDDILQMFEMAIKDGIFNTKF